VRRNSKQERERKLADDARLLRAWKKFHREERDAVRAGPHGVVLAELFRMLENLSRISPAQLVGFAQSIDWAAVDFNAKLVVLHEANVAICKLRERQGLEPIDDALPSESLRAFQLIRKIITEFPAPAGEPTPGNG
jgi:hypothetical protein